MTPRTIKQLELLKKNKENIILEAALLLFAEHGYNTTSMESIAKQAGVSKGNLYNYFKSKESLLESVFQQGINQFSQLYNENQFELLTEDDFEQFVRANFEILKTNKAFWRLYFSLIMQTNVQQLFNKIFKPFLEQYLKMFEIYFQKKGDQNSYATAMLLGGIIDGVSIDYIIMEETYPLEAVIKKIIEKFK
ncbi:MAG: TetR/AcrR family transcriptional regulator [Lutibacter sp.]